MGSTADRIKDIGPQPQSFDIDRATKENTNYRSVAWSGRYLQVTLKPEDALFSAHLRILDWTMYSIVFPKCQ